MLLSDAPFFTSPPPPGSDGVDFLGLRAINLNLMAQAVPGINNVVARIRPFSLIAWMVWRYQSALSAGDLSEGRADEFQRFTEKIESLYVWSHQLAGVTQGMPGMQQSAPSAEPATLSFSSLNRTSNTSLLAAVNYGPASKAPFGLGFIVSVAPGLYAVTRSGQKLAEALDASLKERLPPPLYNVLADVSTLEANAQQAREIFPAWNLLAPTVAERQTFSSRLFQPTLFREMSVGVMTEIGARERTAFIALVLDTLAEHEAGLTVEQLRKALCTRPRPVRDVHAVPGAALSESRALWQVLQVRQAQRLALETLFGFTESLICAGEARDSAELGAAVVRSLLECKKDDLEKAVPFSFDPAVDTESFLKLALFHFEGLASSADELFASMELDDSYDIFSAMRDLEQSAKGAHKSIDACARALVLLAVVAVFADRFKQCPTARKHATEGAAFRIPLHHWAAFVEANVSRPLSRLVVRILETFVVSQHFAIAAARFSDEKSRMRFTVDDSGLTSLLTKPTDILSPSVSRDRLASLLSLCSEAELVGLRTKGGTSVYSVR